MAEVADRTMKVAGANTIKSAYRWRAVALFELFAALIMAALAAAPHLQV